MNGIVKINGVRDMAAETGPVRTGNGDLEQNMRCHIKIDTRRRGNHKVKLAVLVMQT